jgi:UV damage endonuclease UvdE
MKIGFACKYMHEDRSLNKKEIELIEKDYNTKTTTLKWIKSVDEKTAEEKLFSIISHNLESQIKMLLYIKTLPETLHMFRISSDLLPLYTHNSCKWFYKQKYIKDFLEKKFLEIGNLARKEKIRLSMHPGQFCVLASANENIVENSIEEFEYHADMIRMMGYGIKFQDFKCNIHISGQLGVDGMLKVYPRLSEVAKNTITIENEEKKYGVNSCIELYKKIPIVLDVHHCWIHEEDYISINDKRVEMILESWRGVRPTMHYSQSREELYFYGNNSKLEIKEILKKLNKKDLYAHSDKMWNDWSNKYVLDFMNHFDIMFEAKHKNLSTIEFFNQYIKNNH